MILDDQGQGPDATQPMPRTIMSADLQTKRKRQREQHVL
jgi:hypothetical protein